MPTTFPAPPLFRVKRRQRNLIYTASAPGAPLPVNYYTTNFPATENPMLEGGIWTQGFTDGLDWSNYRTTPGKAFGTQTGSGTGPAQYNDSVACLKGTWGTNQYARGVVFNNRAVGDYNTEVELLLRWNINANSTTGYEIEYSARGDNAYYDIVKWNGPLGNYYPAKHGTLPGGAVATGDILEATIIGNTMSMYKNGTLVDSWTDTLAESGSAPYVTGTPGIGHFLRNITATGDPTLYGFTSYTAQTIMPAPPSTYRHYRVHRGRR